jgi:hypothetical protein
LIGAIDDPAGERPTYYIGDGAGRIGRYKMQSLVAEHEAAVEEPQCKHHWLIESPHGATSAGRCKRCGEVREFRNSAADTLWEGDPMSSASKMGGNRPIVREKVAPTLDE